MIKVVANFGLKLRVVIASGVLLASACPYTLANDELTNERFPVDRKLLEQHWNIDCNEAVDTMLSWLNKSNKPKQHLHELASTVSQLRLCGLLFNTPKTGRFEGCPNYSFAHQLLHLLQRGEIKLSEAPIAKALSKQCDM